MADNMRKIIIFTMLLFITIFLCACSSKEPESIHTNEEETIPTLYCRLPKSDSIYTLIDIDMDKIWTMEYDFEQFQIMVGSMKYDSETKTVEEPVYTALLQKPFYQMNEQNEVESGTIFHSVCFTENHDLYLVRENYNEIVHPSEDNPYGETEVTGIYAEGYDTEGNCLFSKEISELIMKDERTGHEHELVEKEIHLVQDGDGYCLVQKTEDEYVIQNLDSEFMVTDQFELKYLENIISYNGQIYFLSDGTVLIKDQNNSPKKIEDLESIKQIWRGDKTADADLFYTREKNGQDELYAYNLKSQHETCFGLGYNSVSNFHITSDETVLYIGSKPETDFLDGISLCFSGQNVIEQEAEKEKISFVKMSKNSQEMELYLADYSRNSSDYIVEIVDLSDSENPLAELNKRILNGEKFDLIDLSGFDYSPLITQGSLENLYTYLENDEECADIQLEESLFSCLEYNQCLYEMTPAFFLMTLCVRESSDVSLPVSGWNVDDFIDYMEEDISQIGCMELLNIALTANMDYFVSDGTSFNSDEFIGILEKCNVHKTTIEEIKMQEEYSDMAYFQETGVLFLTLLISNLCEYYNYMDIKGDMRMMGYPTVSGQGNGTLVMPVFSVGIASASQNKEASWHIIRGLIETPYQEKKVMVWNTIMSRKDINSDMLDILCDEKRFNQEYIYHGNSILGASVYGEVKPLRQEQRDAIDELINNVSGRVYQNTDISTVIYEEVPYYFNGQKSSQDVANVIEKRIRNHVNERE